MSADSTKLYTAALCALGSVFSLAATVICMREGNPPPSPQPEPIPPAPNPPDPHSDQPAPTPAPNPSPTPTPTPVKPRAPWKKLTGERVQITAGHAYAGVVQLGWVQAAVASRDRVEEELRDAIRWQKLEVSDVPLKTKRPVPWTKEPASGRYWAVGIVAMSANIARPDVLAELYEVDPKT